MDATESFRRLFDEAYPAIWGYALHRGLTGADADDLVAGTLEVAWRRLADVPAENPLPWLYGVARNLLRNKHRQDRRHAEIISLLSVAGERSGSLDPADLDAGALRQALAGLSESDRELLKLIAWDGLSPCEAAIALGCSPNAVRTRLHRARNRLAARLEVDPRASRPVLAGAGRVVEAARARGPGPGLLRVVDG